MTTRELLRAAAKLLENAHDYRVEPMHAPTAIALRAIADRFDAEMREAHNRCGFAVERGWDVAASTASAIVAALARLDAPVDPPRRPPHEGGAAEPMKKGEPTR